MNLKVKQLNSLRAARGLHQLVLAQTLCLCLVSGCAKGDADSSSKIQRTPNAGTKSASAETLVKEVLPKNWEASWIESEVALTIERAKQSHDLLKALRAGEVQLAIEQLEVQMDRELVFLNLYTLRQFTLEETESLRQSGEKIRDYRSQYPSKRHSERTNKILENFLNDSLRRLNARESHESK